MISNSFNGLMCNKAGAEQTNMRYLIISLDLCTFPHQHLDDLNVPTAGCNQQRRSPVLQKQNSIFIITAFTDNQLLPLRSQS